MRLAYLLAGWTLLSWAIGERAAGQTPPDVRTIVVAEAKVWCGPSSSDGLYATNRLRQGDRVQVVEELPSGWLAIRPPAGSFSWINKRFLQHISAKYSNYVVAFEGHPVPVLIGSSLKLDRPTKIGVKLPRGAQVRVLGDRTISDDEGIWLPIEPPEGEVRYIRKEDVSPAARKPAAGAAPAAAVPPADGDVLWRDAEKAERAGKLPDAIKLYRLAGDANLAVNRARADAAYQRAHWLQQASSGSQAPSGSYYYPDRDGRAGPPPSQGTTYPLPIDHGGSNAVHLIAPSTPGAPAGQLVSARNSSPYTASPQGGEYGHPVVGHLSKSSRLDGRQRVYLLLNKADHPIMYVRAPAGVDLSSYIDSEVELQGPIVYHPEWRIDILTAMRIRKVP